MSDTTSVTHCMERVYIMHKDTYGEQLFPSSVCSGTPWKSLNLEDAK